MIKQGTSNNLSFSKGQRSWQINYLSGGRELVEELGESLILGQNFVFLKRGWEETPMIRSILRVAGKEDIESHLFSLWGDNVVEITGAVLKQRSIPKLGILGIWTDRELYQLTNEIVKAYIYAPYKAGTEIQVELKREHSSLGVQSVLVDHFGIGYLELQGLPAGEFELRIQDKATTSFVVAIPKKETLNGSWIQQYLQSAGMDRWVLVFVLQLESFGAPLKGEVGINLIDEGRDVKWPVSGEVFRADGAGRVAGELPIVGIGPFSLEIQSLADKERHCFLRIPLDDEEVNKETTSSDHSTSHSFAGLENWRWGGGDLGSTLGFFTNVLEDSEEDLPISIQQKNKQSVIFRSNAQFSNMMAIVLNIQEGSFEEYHWKELSLDQEIELALPLPLGLIFFGGFLDERPWEGGFIVVPEEDSSLKLLLPERIEPDHSFEITIETGEEEEIPVYLIVREELMDDDNPPSAWGPSATLQRELSTLTADFSNGFAEDALSQIKEKRQDEPKEELKEEAEKDLEREMPDGWQAPLPEAENFDRTIFSDILFINKIKVIELKAVNEQTHYTVNAIALKGKTWSYARGDIEISEPTFVELLAPEFIHNDDAMTGEIIIATEEKSLYVALSCDGEPVELWEEEKRIYSNTPIEGAVCEVQFAVKSGDYLLKVFSEKEEELRVIEAKINTWGKRADLVQGLHLLEMGEEITSLEGERQNLVFLPNLSGFIRQLAKYIALQPSGHCEQEASRIRASISWLAVAKDRQDAQEAMRFLKMGLENLSGLLVPKMGFRLYANGTQEPAFGKEAIKHLWEVELFAKLGDNLPFDVWFEDIRQLANEASKGYRINRIPDRISSCRGAYRVYILDDLDSHREEALWECRKRLTQKGDHWGIWGDLAVENRRESAYAAIVLLASENKEHQKLAFNIANHLFAQLSTNNALLGNADNIALLALLEMCQKYLSPHEEVALQIDGEVHDHFSALALQGNHSIKILNGRAVIAYLRKEQNNLSLFKERFPWKVLFYRVGGEKQMTTEAEIGDRLELSLSLPEGSMIGDLLEVYMPQSLLYLGGEQGEPLILELRDCKELTLSFAAIAPTVSVDGEIGVQHWGIRIRNLYKEERGNASFDHQIMIFPTGQKKRRLRDQFSRGWNKIFG